MRGSWEKPAFFRPKFFSRDPTGPLDKEWICNACSHPKEEPFFMSEKEALEHELYDEAHNEIAPKFTNDVDADATWDCPVTIPARYLSLERGEDREQRSWVDQSTTRVQYWLNGLDDDDYKFQPFFEKTEDAVEDTHAWQSNVEWNTPHWNGSSREVWGVQPGSWGLDSSPPTPFESRPKERKGFRPMSRQSLNKDLDLHALIAQLERQAPTTARRRRIQQFSLMPTHKKVSTIETLCRTIQASA